VVYVVKCIGNALHNSNWIYNIIQSIIQSYNIIINKSATGPFKLSSKHSFIQ
jgi:hypothetical protein